MNTNKIIGIFFIFLVVTSCTLNKKVIVAHRGAWKNNNLPENSIASLRHAIDLKLAGSEFDVVMTLDDSLVVNHDPDYNKLVIEKINYADLMPFKLSNGEKLPTLREYIVEGKRNNKNTTLVCEIKPSGVSVERGRKIAVNVVQLVKELHAEKIISYISFDYEILKQIREVDSKASLQYLEGNKSPSEIKKDKITGVDYHYSVFKKHPEWIKEAKDNKITLNVWTVNDADVMDWVIDNKFDYITTNEPELLHQRIKSKK
jgi:glycerophosphoryl diester phosphodiesterase